MLGIDWDESDWDPSDLTTEVQSIVHAREEAGMPPLHVLSVHGARTLLKQAYQPPDSVESVSHVMDTDLPGDAGPIQAAESVPVRVYTPDGEPPFPVMIWLHGGGFLFGGIESEDHICRILANGAESMVISVDYRLAPEHPFPAALEDTYAVVKWASRRVARLGGDPDRIGVGGGSAGGNLTAAVTQLARNLGDSPIKYQLVVYPLVDDDFSRESYRETPEGEEVIEWYMENWLRSPVDRANHYALPNKAKDLSDLPPAEVITANFDVLRDEGKAYADRLEAASVEVSYTNYEEMLHPFFNFDIPQAKTAIRSAGNRFRQIVG